MDWAWFATNVPLVNEADLIQSGPANTPIAIQASRSKVGDIPGKSQSRRSFIRSVQRSPSSLNDSTSHDQARVPGGLLVALKATPIEVPPNVSRPIVHAEACSQFPRRLVIVRSVQEFPRSILLIRDGMQLHQQIELYLGDRCWGPRRVHPCACWTDLIACRARLHHQHRRGARLGHASLGRRDHRSGCCASGSSRIRTSYQQGRGFDPCQVMRLEHRGIRGIHNPI